MKIDFTINGFSDALNLPDDHSLSNQEIESMKQSRYDAWYAIVTNPVLAETIVETPIEE